MNKSDDEKTLLYSEFEALTIQRDNYRKDSESIWISYLAEFGDLLVENLKLKIDCIKEKKRISYIIGAINSQTPLNLKDMEVFILRAMDTQKRQLSDLILDVTQSKSAKTSSLEVVRKVKRYYREIAKMIHPDLHPETVNNPRISDLWSRVQDSYAANDLDEMKDLYILVQMAAGDGISNLNTVSVDELKAKVKKIESEIDKILTTEPYILKGLMRSPQKMNEKKDSLLKEKEEYKDFERIGIFTQINIKIYMMDF